MILMDMYAKSSEVVYRIRRPSNKFPFLWILKSDHFHWYKKRLLQAPNEDNFDWGFQFRELVTN